MVCVFVCVLHVKPSFLPVDIGHILALVRYYYLIGCCDIGLGNIYSKYYHETVETPQPKANPTLEKIG